MCAITHGRAWALGEANKSCTGRNGTCVSLTRAGSPRGQARLRQGAIPVRLPRLVIGHTTDVPQGAILRRCFCRPPGTFVPRAGRLMPSVYAGASLFLSRCARTCHIALFLCWSQASLSCHCPRGLALGPSTTLELYNAIPAHASVRRKQRRTCSRSLLTELCTPLQKNILVGNLVLSYGTHSSEGRPRLRRRQRLSRVVA